MSDNESTASQADGRPIRPAEVVEAKAAQIPAVVFAVFNDLIARNWDGRRSVIRKDDAVREITERDPALTTDEISHQHLLDIEPVYRAAGWGVSYSKPGRNESGNAMFTFTMKY